MQILPTRTVSEMSPQAQLQAAISQSMAQYGQSFADSLSMAESTLAEDASLSEEEHEEERPSESVYSQPTYAAESYNLDEVCFTQQDIIGLLQSLSKNNASPKKLAGLKKLAELPTGANLGQVLGALKGKKEENPLSDEDANAITSLVNALEPSGELAGRILDSLYGNRPDLALRTLTDALDEMDFGEAISVAKDDLLAFGRGLGLGAKNLERMAEFFGEAENGTTTPEGMKKLLAPAGEEILAARKEEETLDQALKKTLGPVLDAAKKRMEQEKEAQTLKSRQAEQSKVYIDRTVKEESRQILNTILDRGYVDAEDISDTDRSHMPDPLAFQSAPQSATQTSSGFFSQGQDFQGSQEKQDSGWKEMLSKIQTKPTESRTPTMHTGFEAQALAEPVSPFAFRANTASQLRHNLPLAQQAAAQVETGLFQSLRNGASRLELQLHPQELGSLAITLVSRNGEVSAHIKADNAETVEMLNKQAEIIRTNLEEQGIKIDSIEIELAEHNNQEKNDQQLLQDMANHNSFQEEDARRQHLRRLRTLATIENNRGNSSSEQLEQSVQRKGESEISATRILDRVA